MGKVFVAGLKLVLLTFFLFFSYSVASRFLGLSDVPQNTQNGNGFFMVLAACALQSVVLSYPILRSPLRGGWLVLNMFLVFYGIATFLTQIETVVFLRYLVNVVPVTDVPGLFLQGTVVAALFSPFAVLIWGKMRRRERTSNETRRPTMSWKAWVLKIILLAVFYVVIYAGFGALIFRPLAGWAFQEYYAGLTLPFWILPFQMVRAILWVGMALLVIKVMEGAWWEMRLGVAFLFSLLMGSLLLFPNPYMPVTIRMAHFVEITSSNFLFGWVAVWVLLRRRPGPNESVAGA